MQRYSITRLSDLPPIPCPCGTARRAFAKESNDKMSLHLVEINSEAQTHYHQRLTEIYYVLEGSGEMELDDDVVQVAPGTAILIEPGCRHRAVGDFKILNFVVPAFDASDEWSD